MWDGSIHVRSAVGTVLSKVFRKTLGFTVDLLVMHGDIRTLREEYKIYIGLSREASMVEGPNSRLARLFRRLAHQVKFELKVYRSATA
jgi:hypothetical protein